MSVARHRASSVCVAAGKLLVVCLADPASGKQAYYPPGGAIEAGETPAAAAVRETREETGYNIVIDEASELVEAYPFQWNGIIYACTTHFFRANVIAGEPAPVHDASYHCGVAWLPLAEVASAFAYAPPIQKAVLALLGL